MPGSNVFISSGGATGGSATTGATAGTNAASGAASGLTGSALAGYIGAGVNVLQDIGTFYSNSQISDTSQYEDLYNEYGAVKYNGDINSILQQRHNTYLQAAPSWQKIRGMTTGDKVTSAISSTASGAMAGAMALGPWGALGGAFLGLGASLGGSAAGDRKAKSKANELAAEREEALAQNQANFITGLNNANAVNNFTALQNISAYGGPIYMRGAPLSPFGNRYAFGGYIGGYGADFTNGLTFIGEGGSHGDNPNGGVPQGIAPDGKPNLVEEGEVLYNDYVFSKRIKVPQAVRQKYKLREGATFADAATKVSKESEERPNDPISKNGLEVAMADLQKEQEGIRSRRWAKDMKKAVDNMTPEELQGLAMAMQNGSPIAACGGQLHHRFDDGGLAWNWAMANPKLLGTLYTDPNFLEYYNTLPQEQRVGTNLSNADAAVVNGLFGTYTTTNALTGEKNFSVPSVVTQPTNKKAKGYATQKTAYDNYSNFAKYNDAIQQRYKDYQAYQDWIAKGGSNATTMPEEYKPITTNMVWNPKTKSFDTNPEGIDLTQLGRAVKTTTTDNGDVTNYYGPESSLKTLEGATTEKPSLGSATWLRYAPVFGSAVGSIASMFSTPDYTNAEQIEDAARMAGQYQTVSFNPVGNYLRFNPYDIARVANEARANSAATARSITGLSNGNKGTMIAGLLANDYNLQRGIGGIYRQAMEYNDAQRKQVEEFNRATNEYNSTGFLEASKANQAARAQAMQARLSGIAQAAQLRQTIKNAHDQSISANWTNFFNNLGAVGKENFSRNMVISNPALYYSFDANGKLTYKNGYENLSEAEKAVVQKDAAKHKKACGGYLTIRRK